MHSCDKKATWSEKYRSCTGHRGSEVQSQMDRAPALYKKKLQISDLVLECFGPIRVYTIRLGGIHSPAIIRTSNIHPPGDLNSPGIARDQ